MWYIKIPNSFIIVFHTHGTWNILELTVIFMQNFNFQTILSAQLGKQHSESGWWQPSALGALESEPRLKDSPLQPCHLLACSPGQTTEHVWTSLCSSMKQGWQKYLTHGESKVLRSVPHKNPPHKSLSLLYATFAEGWAVNNNVWLLTTSMIL